MATIRINLKWYLHRRENITCCRCCQWWWFEKMGGFLLKSHRSAKSLDPNRMCEWTLIGCCAIQGAKVSSDTVTLVGAWNTVRVTQKCLWLVVLQWQFAYEISAYSSQHFTCLGSLDLATNRINPTYCFNAQGTKVSTATLLLTML
jgi:hypothetical protein